MVTVFVGPLGISIEVSVAPPTVSPVFPLTVPDVAVIVIAVALVVSAVATPPAAIVATVVFDDIHVAVAVRSCVVLLLYVPVAVNGVSVPTGTVELAGVTVIETRVTAGGVEVEFPLLHPASSTANNMATHNRRLFMGETPRRNRFF